ncbi:recombinase family protein [Clostridium beijerinckii]|uniref:Recombinase family protein n=1 Tax=Clostridium beijerinckii TaxID=1520 RepID=A0AAW3W6A4_CLOBE|nr:recombinase family protein [Clostridium beijerinckii]MBC2457139.1 recombinase family protein [Clostridium beijerinckii]MBC2474196.1 recombinase family protein [Clostridium beijerinckii]NOV58706.1 DNA invertase Pin-like site-specific DNA recombinase [Clostridium beijerinckii]NOV71909.1 DNA invertase Pin-like site-specific DNA recombinase [Clostridium beijerinckii]NOW32061.1 DNA invertase Pin-like site-specific DNA recombinase [Clostridium beijerinckii]
MSKKKIVAACYCRVSTNTKQQASSLDNQQSYFNDFFRDNSNYRLYKIYPDKGISGTLLHREQFDKMLIDAGLDILTVKPMKFEVGKIPDATNAEVDVLSDAKNAKTYATYKKYVVVPSARTPKFTEILVRNTSRFARNIMVADILNELREKDVYVRFLDINKTSENPEDVSFIQLFQTFDEMFSRDLSRKVKAGNERSVARKVVRSTPRLYGFDYIKRGTLQENNQLKARAIEDDVVRRIYRLYAGCISVYDEVLPVCDYKCDTCTIERTAGVGERVISRCLTESGVKTRTGKEFGITTIANVLNNEKYCGYINTGKYDAGALFSNNKKIKIRDEYLLEPDPNIEAIISKELFDLCQERRSSRYDVIKAKGLPSTSSPFGGLLVCSVCGSKYVHNSDRGRGFYLCGLKKRKGLKTCNSVNVSDAIVTEYMYRLMAGALSADLYQDRQAVFKAICKSIADKINYIESKRDPEKVAQLQADRENADSELRAYYKQLIKEEEKGEDSTTLQRLIDDTKEVLSGIQKQLDRYTKKPIAYLDECKILREYAYELLNTPDISLEGLTKRTYTVSEVLNTINCIDVYGPTDYSGGAVSELLLKPRLKMPEMVKNIIIYNEAIFSEGVKEEKTMENLENVHIIPPAKLKEDIDELSAKLEVLETQYF